MKKNNKKQTFPIVIMLLIVMLLSIIVVIMALKIKDLNESSISQPQINNSDNIAEYNKKQDNNSKVATNIEDISQIPEITTSGYASPPSVDSVSEEITEPTSQNASAYIGKIGIINTESTPLNLRRSNDISSEIIATIPKGAEVKIIESPILNPSGSEYRWYLVEYENVIGYVDTNFIDTTEDTFELNDTHLAAIIQLRFFEARDAIEWQYSPCFEWDSNNRFQESEYTYTALLGIHSKADWYNKINDLFSTKYSTHDRDIDSCYNDYYLEKDGNLYESDVIHRKGNLRLDVLFPETHNIINVTIGEKNQNEVSYNGTIMWWDAKTTINFGENYPESILGSIVYEDGHWKCGEIVYGTFLLG